MKKLLPILAFVFFYFVSAAQIESVLPPIPVPPRLVNDFSGNFISSSQADALERKLVAYDDSTSNQIAIVIVPQLHGYSIDEYAVALGRKWGVGGQKQFNNGVVILVNTASEGDKRGVFIAPGYGMEGAVTDLVAEEIVQNNLIPNFKSGNNYDGLNEATDNIIKAAQGRYTAPEGYHQAGENGFGMLGFILLMIIVFVIILIVSRKGGGNGGYVSRRGYNNWPGGGWIFPGGFTGGGGGGGWSGGGGGGFGGFGGGGFGGGGAGGSW
jgi:uncharacterized protein